MWTVSHSVRKCYEQENEQKLFDPWVYQRHVGIDMKKLPDANLRWHRKPSITHLITSRSGCPSPTDVRVNLPYPHYSHARLPQWFLKSAQHNCNSLSTQICFVPSKLTYSILSTSLNNELIIWPLHRRYNIWKKHFRLLSKTGICENITRGWGTRKEKPRINTLNCNK